MRQEKFFKINLDKLLSQIPMVNQLDLNLNSSQWGMIEGLENNRFWVHISARRTGKSYAAALLAFAKLLEPNTQVMVVAPNFSLSSIIWDYVTQIIRDLQVEYVRLNQKDKIIQLINNSTFRLLSANNRDSLIGRAAHLLIVDEAAVINNDEYFTRDLRPSLSTYSDSRCLWISTPRGKGNYLYDYYLRGQNEEEYSEWGSTVFDWTANPLLNETDIEEARKTMSKNLFGQEYECNWVTTAGQIYNLEENKHLQDLDDINEKDHRFDFIAGLDIGYRDDTAFVVLATEGDKFYAVDEYISKEGTTSAHAENIQELIDKWGIESIFIDSAAQQTKADLAYDYDIYCDNALKSVNDGIAAIQVLVDTERIAFDLNRCSHTYSSLSSYRWNERTETQKPVHDWSSHCSDALRYAVYSYQRTRVSVYA
jgi:PBSX family phage terminase large subunit